MGVPQIAYPPQHRHDGHIAAETKDQTVLVATNCDPWMMDEFMCLEWGVDFDESDRTCAGHEPW